MNGLKIFLAVSVFVAIVDLIWLGYIMRDVYSHDLGSLARRSESGGLAPNLPSAILVYVLIPLGIVLFVLPSFTAGTSLPGTFAWGALFGVVLYGVYDLTSYAVIANFPLRMVCYDIVWGGVLCGSGTLIGRLVSLWLGAK